MNDYEIIDHLNSITVEGKEDLVNLFTHFHNNFILSDTKFSALEFVQIINSWQLKIKEVLENNSFSSEYFIYIYRHIKACLDKIETKYPDSLAFIEKVTDRLLYSQASINNLSNNNTNYRTKISFSLAQAITFMLSESLKDIGKIDIRKSIPLYFKSATHPTIKQDVKVTKNRVSKTMEVEDWYLSISASASGFFSVISSNSQNTANYLIECAGPTYSIASIVDYLEFLKISDKEILNAISAKLKYEKKQTAPNYQNFMKEALQELENFEILFSKKILSQEITPIEPPVQFAHIISKV